MRNPALPADSIAEQAGMVLFSQWKEFCRLRKAALGRYDTDTIHDLRVASRRMRATVGLFAPFTSGRAVKALSKELRNVTRVLGHLRNIDEAILFFNELPGPLPTLNKRLGKARKREARVVIRVLKGFSCRDMGKKLRKMVAVLGRRSSPQHIDESLPVYLSDISIQRYQALYELLAPASMPEDAVARHELRIAIKKWRYLLETIGQVSGQDYGATLETLKEYQGVLGKLNDMVEFATLSDSLSLPDEERQEVRTVLTRTAAGHLAAFMQMAAKRPLQYTFHL